MCARVFGEKRWEKEESKFKTKCGEDCEFAGAVFMLVMQPHFASTVKLADWLFLRIKLDFFYFLFFLSHGF